jgi:5'-nucleotidase
MSRDERMPESAPLDGEGADEGTEVHRDLSLGELSSRTAPPEEELRPPRSELSPLRALITNDDGIESTGLYTLALVAQQAGLEVVVAAPLRDCSGASSSIMAVEDDGHFVVEPRRLPELPGVEAYGVGAVPAFIALTGVRGAFGPPPDIVLSGVNKGFNTGHAILHSGTVGAALTASTHSVRAMAVSMGFGTDYHWETAASVAGRALSWLVHEAVGGMVLNVNVPNVALSELAGFSPARLASFGAVQFNVSERGEGYVKMSLSEINAELEPGTDAALLADGWATYTLLSAVCEATEVEPPDLSDLGVVRSRG